MKKILLLALFISSFLSINVFANTNQKCPDHIFKNGKFMFPSQDFPVSSISIPNIYNDSSKNCNYYKNNFSPSIECPSPNNCIYKLSSECSRSGFYYTDYYINYCNYSSKECKNKNEEAIYDNNTSSIKCVDKCQAPQIRDNNGTCSDCPPDKQYFKGECVDKCPEGQTRDETDGTCENCIMPESSCPAGWRCGGFPDVSKSKCFSFKPKTKCYELKFVYQEGFRDENGNFICPVSICAYRELTGDDCPNDNPPPNNDNNNTNPNPPQPPKDDNKTNPNPPKPPKDKDDNNTNPQPPKEDNNTNPNPPDNGDNDNSEDNNKCDTDCSRFKNTHCEFYKDEYMEKQEPICVCNDGYKLDGDICIKDPLFSPKDDNNTNPNPPKPPTPPKDKDDNNKTDPKPPNDEDNKDDNYDYQGIGFDDNRTDPQPPNEDGDNGDSGDAGSGEDSGSGGDNGGDGDNNSTGGANSNGDNNISFKTPTFKDFIKDENITFDMNFSQRKLKEIQEKFKKNEDISPEKFIKMIEEFNAPFLLITDSYKDLEKALQGDYSSLQKDPVNSCMFYMPPLCETCKKVPVDFCNLLYPFRDSLYKIFVIFFTFIMIFSLLRYITRIV